MPLNKDVTRFLNELDHPLREEIETLRQIILEASALLEENIKWNGPNYSVGVEDQLHNKELCRPVQMHTSWRSN